MAKLKLKNPNAEIVLAGLMGIRKFYPDADIDALTAYHIGVLTRELGPKVKTFQEQRAVLNNKYGKPLKLKADATEEEKERHERDKPMEIPKSKQPKYQKEIKPLLEAEITLNDIELIEVAKLPPLKLELMDMLYDVLVFEKPKPKAKAKAKK